MPKKFLVVAELPDFWFEEFEYVCSKWFNSWHQALTYARQQDAKGLCVTMYYNRREYCFDAGDNPANIWQYFVQE